MMKYEKGERRIWERRKIFVNPWHEDKRIHQPETTVRIDAGWTGLVVHQPTKDEERRPCILQATEHSH